jgi:hydrogenase maturation factor
VCTSLILWRSNPSIEVDYDVNGPCTAPAQLKAFVEYLDLLLVDEIGITKDVDLTYFAHVWTALVKVGSVISGISGMHAKQRYSSPNGPWISSMMEGSKGFSSNRRFRGPDIHGAK